MADLEFYSKIDFLELWYSHQCSSTFDLLPQVNSAQNFAAVFSFNQTNGKGQNNNSWHSQPFMNLAFSTWLPIPNWAIENLVLYNMRIAVSLLNCLHEFTGAELKLKWPNDIYFANKKLSGMLMSVQSHQGKRFLQLGIGINGNEIHFPPELPNPISITQILEEKVNLYALAETIAQTCVDAMNKPNYSILEAYNAILYKRSNAINYEFQNQLFTGIIVGTNEYGQLAIEIQNKTVYYHQGEIKLLIN